jgi:hypothetical protein
MCEWPQVFHIKVIASFSGSLPNLCQHQERHHSAFYLEHILPIYVEKLEMIRKEITVGGGLQN